MENKESILNDLLSISQNVIDSNIIPFSDLPEYDLFLSQVVDYLNDRFEGEDFTNNIVQNYVKNEVVSKPQDGKKRGYTKVHLTELVLLGHMRPILTSDEIKKVFRLAFNDINDRTDDIIPWESAYKSFTEIQKNAFSDLQEKGLVDEVMIKELIKPFQLNEKETERIVVFLTVMTLIAQASAIKKLARKIIDEYSEE
ncbi:DUF1836 domain-containing protein [Clostridium cellulovorans]|uniref:DUF1836 domain-containing protein n=1 Tax=Clostridium cellulovorans (strain ATCC 35296 / DSM 3052 / OCM 3 / 743B) TaxID=573061 RepID=D9SNN4_CLOC7|nr:DUF1836 domain-containing protein [Clostridium cellulovorans]ADL49905.1 Domain of unknown function DUF1836 [Clostridium cellulovorans 743B]